MKTKRLVILTLVLSVIFASTIYADSLWGSYQGFSKVKVNINGQELALAADDVPPLSINGTTMLPLRKVAESLQAIVNWDSTSMTANIYKPNVHMILANSVAKDFSAINLPFGKVDHGTLDFVVFVQVDSLKVASAGFKISVVTPSGVEQDSKEVNLKDTYDSFGYTCQFKSEQFDKIGTYLVDFSLKNADGNYVVVSQKAIVSK